MKVFFDYDIFQNQRYGGISRYISYLHSSLAAVPGVESYLCAPFCDNEYLDSLAPDIPIIGDWPKLLKLPFGKTLAREIVYRASCLYIQPDILHGSFFYRHKANFPSKKFVVTLHDMINELLPQHFGPSDPMPAHKRAAITAADHVICISEKTRSDAIAHYGLPVEKFSVVYHGAPQLPSPAPLPMALQGRPFLLFVGQRGGYKNFATVLTAFGLSKQLSTDFVLVCCGGGEFTPAEAALINRLKLGPRQVEQFSGDDALLAALYAGATLLVYPSLYEGFGMPLLEAFGVGCPVVSTPCGAIPEIAGPAIEYVADLSVDAFAAAMAAVAYNNNRATALRELGRLRHAHFSWDRCTQETIIAYQKALAGQAYGARV